MDLNHVAVFARVVELASFTAAAKLLGLPKSSVSRAVTRLEEELGVRLLQRTTRQLHLTEAGQLYYERARGALSSLDEAASAASTLSAEPRGIVRVTAPGNIGAFDLAELLARFSRQYPLVHVELSMSSRIVDLVAEGFDLALRAGRMADSTLTFRRIGTDSLGLFASRNYLRRRGRPKTIADLAQHDCVLFRGRNGKAEWHVTGPHGQEVVTVRGPVNADEMSFLIQATTSGLGIALLPRVAVRLSSKAAGVAAPVHLFPDYQAPGGELNLVMPTTRLQPASVVALRDFLLKEMTALWNSV
jgi:DNA-binding transcriptional LysR family regulator